MKKQSAFSRFVVLFTTLGMLLICFVASAQTTEQQRQERVSALIPVLMLLLLDEDEPKQEQPEIAVSQESISVFVGESAGNEVSGGAGSGALIFTSSNDSIAQVDEFSGLITGVSTGMVTITVFKRGDGIYLAGEPVSFTVLVMEKLTQQTLEAQNSLLQVLIGDTVANVITGGSGTGDLSFTSADPSIASVDQMSGVIQGISAGSTTITVNKAGDASFQPASPITFNVTVNKLTQSTLSFASSSLSIQVGVSETRLAQGGDGTGAITYSSDAPSVAVVDSNSGEITGVSVGNATITAVKAGDSTYLESNMATYSVVVSEAAVPPCVWDSTSWDECEWQ